MGMKGLIGRKIFMKIKGAQRAPKMLKNQGARVDSPKLKILGNS